MIKNSIINKFSPFYIIYWDKIQFCTLCIYLKLTYAQVSELEV